jgi:nucleotide-binding universal stress UspA family protein
MPYHHILVPLKGDEGDGALLEHAAALAAMAGAKLTLAHVVHVHSRDAAAYLNDQAAQRLGKQAALLRAQGREVEFLIRDGEAAVSICQAARETGADLILMGSHGHNQVRHFLLGSVTEHVIRGCQTPVLLLRPQAPPHRQ